jgi:hypothetical protein
MLKQAELSNMTSRPILTENPAPEDGFDGSRSLDVEQLSLLQAFFLILDDWEREGGRIVS